MLELHARTIGPGRRRKTPRPHRQAGQLTVAPIVTPEFTVDEHTVCMTPRNRPLKEDESFRPFEARAPSHRAGELPGPDDDLLVLHHHLIVQEQRHRRREDARRHGESGMTVQRRRSRLQCAPCSALTTGSRGWPGPVRTPAPHGETSNFVRIPPPIPDVWNVILTTRNGRRRDVRMALRRLAPLSACGFRNLLIGQVDDFDAFLAAVGDLCEHQPFIRHWIGHIRPIERTFPIEIERFVEQLQEESQPLLDRLAGKTFHVRLDRRGHKGRIDTHAVERALGEHLYTSLTTRGLHPTVTFSDPDVVLTVDILRDVAGLALITRELRQRSPLIKIT